MRRAPACLLLLVALLSPALSARAAPRPRPAARPTPAPKFVPGQLLVQFKQGAQAAQALSAIRGKSSKTVSDRGSGRLVLATLPSNASVEAAVRTLSSRFDVKYAEPNYIYRTIDVPNDPQFGSLWGMRGGYGSRAEAAWDRTNDCSSVYVGVIDEGIDFNHPDLEPNMWKNAQEVHGDGIDNDGNGYVDDVNGWDFVNRRGRVYTATDGDNHGTHCAGTIAARGNNGQGVAGMCWNAKIISGKIMANDQGTLDIVIEAINYMTDLKIRKGLNIVATSNSWGLGPFSYGLLDAINRGHANGILFIAAAGNGATNARAYPAAYSMDTSAVISVAWINEDGSLPNYINSRGMPEGSNFGDWVHLGAPGGNILSTMPGGVYGIKKGTSMATPHVSGAAALYKATYPSATPAEIRDAILRTAVPTASLQNGKTTTGGRLDVAAMLAVVPPSVLRPPLYGPSFPGFTRCVRGYNLRGANIDGMPLTLSTLVECMAECARRPGCDSFVFMEKGQCWLKQRAGSSGLTGPDALALLSCFKEYAVPGMMHCSSGYDLQGGDLPILQTSNSGACMQACRDNSKCDRAVYRNDTSCYLKRLAGQDGINGVNDAVVLSCVKEVNAPISGFTSCSRGYDVDGGHLDDNPRRDSNEADCLTQCRGRKECDIAVLTTSGDCWLKRRAGGDGWPGPNTNVVLSCYKEY